MAGGGSGSNRKEGKGGWSGREKGKKKKKRKEKISFGFCSNFQNPILYHSRFFGTKFHFLHNLNRDFDF